MLTDVIQAIFAALPVGCIYALVALGVALIYNATNIINFAQGEFVMLGGMSMVTLYGEMHVPIYLSIFASVAIATIIGMALMKVAYRPGKNTSLIIVLIITIGASLFISGSAMHIWDADIHRFPAFSGEKPIVFLGAAIVPQSLWVIGLTFLLVISLVCYFQFTIHGKAMKACALDRTAAGLLGIKVKRMVLISFAMSSALGALAGIIMTPLTMIDYSGGMLLAIKGFSAAMLGGMGSFVGAVIGGFVFSFLESFTATFVSGSFKELVTFIVIINVLLFMPNGIMGPRSKEGLEEEEVLGE
ncbi:MAG: branched-chain amino acid ABC transporter permease [Desulfobacterales bacterium]|jgi:branched-chain amino acid transport system permease protein|nr:branched-chain amino acid ABC transporter permease [Desulfobacter sp.]MDP6683925.1 branched-chain amino acid ABC transporter permease [Desulfobacterales bacterium]MDP6808662.1 branched-chain amino acid ABC transporter permease [Desulfobacterales bacterium]|tara:strand:+ start:3334 stop:4236 length:903 start_codon:yes stop_codon:yes gene_type:complete